MTALLGLSNKSDFNDFTPAKITSDGVIFKFGDLLDISLLQLTRGISFSESRCQSIAYPEHNPRRKSCGTRLQSRFYGSSRACAGVES